MPALKNIFENIYKTKEWGPGSGLGSLPENTEEYRKFLQNFLKKNGVKTVLDAGCGDWQFSKLIDWTGINYTGIDVVPFLIEENNKKYARKNIKFYKKNILESGLPETDLIILKDVLQHLSNKNILNFLPELKKFKFALIINDDTNNNTDCMDGGYRPVNLQIAPFRLIGKIFFLSQNNHFKGKHILLLENSRNKNIFLPATSVKEKLKDISSFAVLTNEEKKTLLKTIIKLKPEKSMEIGAKYGGSAAIMCSGFLKNKKGSLKIIDIYPQISEQSWDILKNWCSLEIGDFANIIKNKKINEKFDFIFIDGDHNYEAVKKDCHLAWSVLEPNGNILFHDAFNAEVKQAINDFLAGQSDAKDLGMVSKIFVKDGEVYWGGMRLIRKKKGLALYPKTSHWFKIIESKRNSKNLLWQGLILIKDCGWIAIKYFKIISNFILHKEKKINYRVQIGANAPQNGKINVLYIYDKYNWAIHNVGKLWLDENAKIQATYKAYSETSEEDFAEYDLIWFGYSWLTEGIKCDLKKCVVAVHDPAELFPQVKNWKSKFSLFSSEGLKYWQIRRKKIKEIKKAGDVIVASEEMRRILLKYGVNSTELLTVGSAPLRDKKTIKTEKCSMLSVFQPLPRKNIKLLKELEEYCKTKTNIKFYLKIGDDLFSKEKYIKILDDHEIYVCASFQEGGPIPAMEAMARGAVVLITPVGQMPEIIENGKNGFICKTKEEFIEKINLLAQNLDLLHKMRLKSLEAILKKRDAQEIRNKVFNLLKKYAKV